MASNMYIRLEEIAVDRIMKYLMGVVLSILLVSSNSVAQRRSAVTDAHSIYVSCMNGYSIAADTLLSRAEIKQFIKDANDQCLIWLVVWYGPLTGDAMQISDWDNASLDKLDAMINRTMSDMNKEIKPRITIR